MLPFISRLVSDTTVLIPDDIEMESTGVDISTNHSGNLDQDLLSGRGASDLLDQGAVHKAGSLLLKTLGQFLEQRGMIDSSGESHDPGGRRSGRVVTVVVAVAAIVVSRVGTAAADSITPRSSLNN